MQNLAPLITIRKATDSDFSACQNIYQTNEKLNLIPPQYEQEFCDALTSQSILTLVATLNDQVVACGGIHYFGDTTSASLSFGLVHPSYQKRKIGTSILLARMSLLDAAIDQSVQVFLSATQYSKSFFSKIGFVPQEIEQDTFGNLFEAFSFTLTKPLLLSCRQALKDGKVSHPSDLEVPIRSL